jgi:hypothetical protein
MEMKLVGVNIGWNVGTMVLGAAALLLGPMLVAVAGGLAKSIVKTGIKTGMLMYDKGKEIATDAKETMEGITAEAKSEMAAAQQAKSTKS